MPMPPWWAHDGVTSEKTSDCMPSASSGATSIAGQLRRGTGLRELAMASTARRPVDDRIDRQPAQDDKVPVDRVLADVAEALAFERAGEEERRQHARVP